MDVALIGCGAIGTSVLRLLVPYPQIQVRHIVTSGQGMTAQAQAAIAEYAPEARIVSCLPAQEQADLLVECAGHSALEEHVLPALENGISAVVASIGGLSLDGMLERIETACKGKQAQIYLVSGAMGAIDALAAARFGGLEEVTYIGRKPPKAWQGTAAEALCDLSALRDAFCLFEGTAGEAAQRYPKNANVAATVSLAGIGLERTRVRLFADPAVSGNVHQLKASGAFGQMELTMRGNPLAENPKTSALTVYSLLRSILNHQAAVVI